MLLDLAGYWAGVVAGLVFGLACALVIVEEFTLLRKSKPAILAAAGIIWAVIAFRYATESMVNETEEAVRHFLVEFAELFLFLLSFRSATGVALRGQARGKYTLFSHLQCPTPLLRGSQRVSGCTSR